MFDIYQNQLKPHHAHKTLIESQSEYILLGVTCTCDFEMQDGEF